MKRYWGRLADHGTAPGLVVRRVVGSMGPRGILMGGQFVVSILAARALGAVELGLFASAIAIGGLLALASGAQLSQLLQRGPEEWSRQTVVATSLLSGGIGAIATAILGAAAIQFGADIGPPLLAFTPAVFARPFLQAGLGRLGAEGKISATILMGAPNLFGRLVYLLPLLFLGRGGTASGILFAESLATVAFAALTFRTRAHADGPRDVASLAKEAGQLVLSAGSVRVQRSADAVALERFVGPEATGQYFAASRILDVGTQAYSSALAVFVGDVARERGDESKSIETFRHYWRVLRRLIVAPVFVAGMLLPGFGPWLLGSDFTIDPWVSVLLAFAVVLQVAPGPVGQMLIVTKSSDLLARAGMIAAACNIVGNVVGVGLLREPTVAAAVLAGSVALNNALLHIGAAKAGLGLLRFEDLYIAASVVAAFSVSVGFALGLYSAGTGAALVVAAIVIGEFLTTTRRFRYSS